MELVNRWVRPKAIATMNLNATALLSALGGAVVPLALLSYTGLQAVAMVSECKVGQAKPHGGTAWRAVTEHTRSVNAGHP